MFDEYKVKFCFGLYACTDKDFFFFTIRFKATGSSLYRDDFSPNKLISSFLATGSIEKLTRLRFDIVT